MARSSINFDTVRKIGLALPGVEESTAFGNPALKLHGKLLACVPSLIARPNQTRWLCSWNSMTAPNCLPLPPMCTTSQTTMSAIPPCWFVYLASMRMSCETCLVWPTNL